VDTAGPFLMAAWNRSLSHQAQSSRVPGTGGDYLLRRSDADRSRASSVSTTIDRGDCPVHGAGRRPSVARDMAMRASGLPVRALSVSGAGDSFLATMLWSLVNGDNLETSLALRGCRRFCRTAQPSGRNFGSRRGCLPLLPRGDRHTDWAQPRSGAISWFDHSMRSGDQRQLSFGARVTRRSAASSEPGIHNHRRIAYEFRPPPKCGSPAKSDHPQ